MCKHFTRTGRNGGGVCGYLDTRCLLRLQAELPQRGGVLDVRIALWLQSEVATKRGSLDFRIILVPPKTRKPEAQ